MSTESMSQSEFGQQPNADTPLTANMVDIQPPLELTLEQKTPVARWAIITVLGIVVFSILTYWINSDNPKIDATALAAMQPEAAPTATLVANEAGYSASVIVYPPDPIHADTTVIFTTTILLNGQPVEGVRVEIFLDNARSNPRTIKAGVTGPDGVTVSSFNIAKIFGDTRTVVSAGFFDGDKLLIRVKTAFIPTR